MIGRRRDPQPLGALGNGRIVDRLNIDAVLFKQDVGRLLAGFRVADEQRHDMGIACHDREPGGRQDRLDSRGAVLVAFTFPVRCLEMTDRRGRSRAYRRRQRGGEDEAGGVGAHGVDDPCIPGDIAAQAAEGLCERAFENIDAVHDAVALGDTAAARAIHADRMNFIDIGHRAVALGQIADLGQWRDVAVHRIEAFAGDQLWPIRSCGAQQLLKMGHVAVAENLPLAAGLANAFDHRIMVERIRQDQAVRNEPGDRCDAGLVRHIARSEQERCLLAVEIGEFCLELDQRMMRTGDIAGATGASTDAGRGLDHGADHLGMLAHAEIIVGAPDHDVALALRRVPDRMREATRDALEIGENAIAPLVMEAIEGGTEELAIIHRQTCSGNPAGAAAPS